MYVSRNSNFVPKLRWQVFFFFEVRRTVVCFIIVRPRITDSTFTARIGNTLRTLPVGESGALQAVLANCTNFVTGLTDSLMRRRQLCNHWPQLSLRTTYNFCARISINASVSEGIVSFYHYTRRPVIKAAFNKSLNARSLVKEGKKDRNFKAGFYTIKYSMKWPQVSRQYAALKHHKIWDQK